MRIFFEEWRMLESYNSSAPTDEFTEINEEASVRTDEMPLNSAVQTVELQDYDRPMGVATYKTSADMDERLKKLLPPVEALKKLL